MVVARPWAIALLLLLVSTGLATAAHPEERGDIENLRQRIEALEDEKAHEEEAFAIRSLSQMLRFSGLLELEASYTKVEGGDESSDLTLATAQLGVEALVSDNIAGHLILLHEEGADESIEVDEAVISLSCPVPLGSGRLSLNGGKLYVPFGKFNSYLVSDPLTLELGETNNTALVLGWAVSDLLDLQLGTFSGETDTTGDEDRIDTLVASLEVTPMEGLAFGASFISDLAESDIGLVHEDPVLGNVYDSSVPGASAFLSWAIGPFALEGEFLTATKDFDAAVVAQGEELTGPRPQAWNLELAWMPKERWQLAVRVEEAKDFQDDLTRYGAAASYGLFEGTVVALEYLMADPEADDADAEHSVTAQLALEF